MPKSKKKSKKKKRYKVEPSLSTQEAWQQFQVALAAALSDLDEDEFLIVTARATQHFVQFAGQGPFGMRAEARSNNFIDDPLLELSKKVRRDLIELGWKKPTYVPSPGVPEPADGAPNYYLDAARPVPYATLAALSVDSLREVYGVRFLSELEYIAFSKTHTSIRFPHLPIRRQREGNVSPGAGFASAIEELEDDTEHCCVE